MVPQLTIAFGTTALGVSTIVRVYYYTLARSAWGIIDTLKKDSAIATNEGPGRAQHITEACENSTDARRSVGGTLASKKLLTIDVSHLIADLGAT